MSGFDKSKWSDKEFSKGFRDRADQYIPHRRTLISTALSYYTRFIKDGSDKRILDLGCGDGIITDYLMRGDKNIKEALLLDASKDMISSSKERLKHVSGVTFVTTTFEEMMIDDALDGSFDFVVSSLAIHHLKLAQKRKLFDYIYAKTVAGGAFVNIDVVLSPTDSLEQWYLQVWTDWLKDENQRRNIATSDAPFTLPVKYKDNPGNTPDVLSAQLKALKKSGFVGVDCFYKYAIFAVFGGSKQGKL